MRLALRELHAAAPAPVDIVPLPDGAPFGTVEVNVEGCTLCLSCVSACPTGALSDDPERPMLRFAEDACVQCGLCKATCPEKVISLKPQIDFRAATAMSRVIKQEDPAECIRCGKPFGVKSSVERVVAKLEGKHWMYKDSKKRLDVIRMCDNCRVEAMAEEQFDPFGAPRRAPGAHHRRLSARTRGKGRKLATFSSWPSPENPPAPCDPPPIRSSAPASWCRACSSPARPRTTSTRSPASTRCRAFSAPAKNCSPATSRCGARIFRTSVGPALLPSSEDNVWQATQARKISAPWSPA